MMAFFSVAVFASAFSLSVAVIAAMVVPQWRRILRLATGHREESFAPLRELALAERRIAVRRWATGLAPTPATRFRAAA